MTRRDFLRAALAAAPAAACFHARAAGALQPVPHRRPKRGLGFSTRPGIPWQERLEMLDVSWFYSWAARIPDAVPPGIEFVPMVFGRAQNDTLSAAAEAFRAHDVRYLLGFNEPDSERQANLTVEEALDLWPKLMEFDLPLGSPGCVHPDRDWMQDFMAGVEARALRVDFVCVHSYGNLNARALMDRLAAVHRRFGRPIWITEMGVGDWKAESVEENIYDPEEIVAFMEELLPQLDGSEIVDRYAWFPAARDNRALGPNALFDADGSLTPVGETYRSI